MDSLWLRDINNKPNIVLFGRDYHDRTKTVRTIIKNYEPYFYAPSNVATGVRRLQNGSYRVEADIYTDALGRQVRKVFTDLPSTVPKIRDNFEFTDEADILFDKRYVVDKGITYAYEVDRNESPHPVSIETPIKPRVVWFDIEVRSEKGVMPQPLNPMYPIVSIQCMDSYTKDIVVFTNCVPKVHDSQNVCDSEVELLVEFARYIKRLDPDILSGWYSNGFDIPYILSRAGKLGVSLKDMSRVDMEPTARNEGYKWFIKVPGRQCFDLLEGFKKYYKPKGELDAYDLKSVISNSVVMEEDAFSYVDYGDKINELFENEDWDTFIKYCTYDVVALDTIDNHLQLIDFYEHLRMIAGVKIEETLMNSRVVESLIMRAGIKPMPTKNYKNKDGEKFDGATVLTPPIGIHSDVGVVDLTALYPNIMVGFGISPDIDGVVCSTVRVIMDERDKLRYKVDKTSVEKNKETVLKYLANSFYGVIGWSKFRLYNRDQAARITSIGRELNEYLQGITKENGYVPIYGDTDSIFIRGITSIEEGNRFQSMANDKLRLWSIENGSSVSFSLKFEKLYRRLMFKRAVSGEAAKKRYAGHLIFKDGKDKDELDYTGIELKRSDQSTITKQLLRQFLLEVLINDNESGAISMIRDAIKNVKNGNVSIHDVSIPKGVNITEGRSDPWIRGLATTHKLFNISISQGIKPRLIYIKGTYKELCIEPGIDEQMVLEKCDVDWDMCCKKTVEMKMRTFVESIGYGWDEVINGQRTLI